MAAKTSQERRAFFRKGGVAVGAAFASSLPATSASGTILFNTQDDLRERLAALEDNDAIRLLWQQYTHLLSESRHDKLASLFTADAELSFSGNISPDCQHGIQQVLTQHTSMLPKRLLQNGSKAEQIDIAADRQSATACFHAVALIGHHLSGDSTAHQMARLQGMDELPYWEEIRHDINLVKDKGSWQIHRLQQKTDKHLI